MGEVYRARDIRLDRTVALKVLRCHLAASPERRRRFEREAKAIAALNHPHICTLHDLGHHEGIDFLVMEYLEGDTLATRLHRGALPLEQVLRYGVEMAQALDAAHRERIVHRDLKPGNVMLTKSGAKLLDFGLAKLRAPGASPSSNTDLSDSPTEDMPLTTEGEIVGTFQYMAPEQIEGKELDARMDIFALGAVLYEMATGRRAFSGKTRTSLVQAILSSQPPPISRLQPLAPPALDRVVASCLAKDPDDRWRNAHDLARELKWIGEGGRQAGVPASVAPRRRSRERLVWTAVAVASALLGIALYRVAAGRHESPPKPQQARFQIPPPDRTTFTGGALALSPDGERIAFTAVADGGRHVYVRPLNSFIATRVPGTEGGFGPFWSPDGRQLGFGAPGKLKKVDFSGLPAQTLCHLDGHFSGASWSPEGIIVFSNNGQLFRVPAGGGTPQPIGTRVDGETARYFPHFLPDGRRYLYLSQAVSPERQGIYVASLDSGDRKRVVASDHNAAYSPSGHLLFLSGDALMAQAFDPKTLKLYGEAFQVSEQVALSRDSYPGAAYDVSPSGVLAWRTGSELVNMRLTWFDRSGRNLGTVGEPADYSNPALSPDEKSLAVGRVDPRRNTRDLWVFDLIRGTSTRLTFDPADDINPTWSPDGTRIAFTSDRRRVREIYQKPADGSGDDELVLESEDWWKNVEDWSADGRFLVYNYHSGGVPADLFLLPLSPGADRRPIPFLATRFQEHMGQLAPNGKWLAYCSDESGRDEVYVDGVSPDGTGGRRRWLVSAAGGREPRWRRDGQELFYVSGGTFMAVEVKTDGASFEAGTPKPLFKAPLLPEARRNRFVVTRDGQRFLVNTVLEQTSEPIHVLMNWRPPNR